MNILLLGHIFISHMSHTIYEDYDSIDGLMDFLFVNAYLKGTINICNNSVATLLSFSASSVVVNGKVNFLANWCSYIFALMSNTCYIKVKEYANITLVDNKADNLVYSIFLTVQDIFISLNLIAFSSTLPPIAQQVHLHQWVTTVLL